MISTKQLGTSAFNALVMANLAPRVDSSERVTILQDTFELIGKNMPKDEEWAIAKAQFERVSERLQHNLPPTLRTAHMTSFLCSVVALGAPELAPALTGSLRV